MHAGAEIGPRRPAPVRVLIADDSGFFRRRIVEQLAGDPMIEVVGCAENGLEAVNEVRRLRPAVLVLDIEMPVMNGIDALRRIMRETPTPVIVFSNLTRDGARVTLDALDAGAADYLSKTDMSDRSGFARAADELRSRIRALGGAGTPAPPASTGARRATRATPTPAAAPARRSTGTDAVSRSALAGAGTRAHGLVIIGASTGGPVALQRILTDLPADYPVPVLVVQHMPESFTPTFAARMDSVCDLVVSEAADGDELRAGRVLLAPGGRQLEVCRRGRTLRVQLRAAAPGEHYRPSVDVAFASAAAAAGGEVLAIVLTGMGADGRDGARALKAAGADVWVQDRESCVVYGMPAAVAQAGLADRVVRLADIGQAMRQAG